MSTVLQELPSEHADSPAAPIAPRADTLAASVVILLAMTVAQRLIGFGRGIMFCRWLEPEQLGQWDVAFGFLNLAAALAVLGLPGSFGRYVEYFRRRRQFHPFLWRTSIVSVLTGVAAAAVMIVCRRSFSRLIFGSEDESSMVVWLALALGVIIVHNFLCALFIAVRMYSFVTVLQFVQSVGFAIVSLGLLAVWPAGASDVIIAYGAATLFSAFGAIHWLKRVAASEPQSTQRVSHGAFWAKLAPFAIWMWITNLLANLFELVDRYMIIHHSGMEANEALRQVGYYHSSRIVPLLFVAVAGLLGSLITPNLSHDWEAGLRESVARRLNMVLKLLLISLLAASTAVLFFAPFLFNVAFQEKFQGGMVVLPWTLTYCAWFGTIAVAQNYLWCVERPGISSFSLLAGVLVNIGFNLLLLPRYGLEGAVWATTLANFVALMLIYLFSRAQGMHVDFGTWVLSFAPVVLSGGPWVSLATLTALVVWAICGRQLFTADEKKQFWRSFEQGLDTIRDRISRAHRGGADFDIAGESISRV